MKKIIIKTFAVVMVVAMIFPIKTHAQNKFTVSGNVNFVSDYIWRGADQNSGFSVQPSLTLSYAGIALNVWGSQTLSRWNVEYPAKEFDINLSYSLNNFSITVSDYWWSGVNKPYGHYKDSHFFEGTLAYCFGESFPLALSWSTMFAGADKNEEGKLQASTYINASYLISLPADITLTPGIGFTPWKGYYHNKAAFTDISLKCNKDLKVTDKFSIPVFIQAIIAPVSDRTYLVEGFNLGF